MAAGPIVNQEMPVCRVRPPLRRCVLLGSGGTPDAKRPLAGRSWLRPRSRAEVRAHTGNLGCRTGDVDGAATSLWVLDFDAKAGGLEALTAWEAKYGRIPGWRVRTGSGGLHIYTAGAPGLRSRKLPVLRTALEVELKANGSYVVFAGSTHENGRRYEPETPEGLDALAQAPRWLLELAYAGIAGAGVSPSGGDSRTWVQGGIYDIPASVYQATIPVLGARQGEGEHGPCSDARCVANAKATLAWHPRPKELQLLADYPRLGELVGPIALDAPAG
jgi:hypothetical protein